MAANWGAANGLLEFAAKAPATIGTEKEYENFELWIEWRSEGEAGMAVRSMPLIRLGGAAGTGLARGGARAPRRSAPLPTTLRGRGIRSMLRSWTIASRWWRMA